VAVAITFIRPTEIYSADSNGRIQGPNAVPIISEEKLIELAKHDYITLFKLAIERYEKSIGDYTGTFYKQERIRGKLGKEQTIAFKFKEKPYSIYMEWKKNSGATDKLLYVKDQNNNKMIVHPTGLLSWVRSVKRNPGGKDARKSSLYTCDQFGFYYSMKRILKDNKLAKKSGDLKIKYIGLTKVHGRRCIALERILPKKKGYSTARLIIKLDIEYLLPVALERYGWDNKLIFRNSFRDLKFNTGLKNEDFKPAVYGL
jgi:outer membrane lipoprotein-sorting protein